MRLIVMLSVLFAAAAVAASAQPAWDEIAERAVREAAERAARERASTEETAKAVAEEAAKAAAESAVRSAAEKAPKAAAESAAKAAATAAAKEMTDEKAAREEAEKKAAAAKAERKEELARIETRTFKPNHASAEEVAQKLNEMWNGEFGQVWKVTRMAIAFPESNTILVTAPRLILDACEKAVQALDVEASQVYIEARFVELGNTASRKVGIDWSLLGGMSGTATLGAGIQSTTIGNGVREYSRALTTKGESTTYMISSDKDTNGDVSYFNGTLNFSQMSLTLKALDATEDAKTFSNPKIIVSSGKKAVVDMTTKYPNVKVAAKRTEASGSTSLDIASSMEAIPGEDKFMFAKEAFFSWGISLEVTPRIGTNGLINVAIVPTISSQEGWVETGTTSESDSGSVSTRYPVIEVQRLVTEFKLASGSTAVIGGLSMTKENQVDNGIPWLRDIPLIGPRIFGSLERVKEQKEIIVFVTVGLVNPREMAPDAGLPKNAILGRQYTKGQKLEPGDKPEKNMEGCDSLDLRLLEGQAKDPLQTQRRSRFDFSDYLPFKKDPEYRK